MHSSTSVFAAAVEPLQRCVAGSLMLGAGWLRKALNGGTRQRGVDSDTHPIIGFHVETGDNADHGGLLIAFGPADQQSEDRAIRTAKALAEKHVVVIAWSREANPDIGEYGPPTTLFVSGDVPDME